MEQLKLPFKFKKDEELIRKKRQETFAASECYGLSHLTTYNYEDTQTGTTNIWCYRGD